MDSEESEHPGVLERRLSERGTAIMVELSVVKVLSQGTFWIVGDRTGGPLLESGHDLPKGLEGRGLLLQEPAQRHGLQALLGQNPLEGLESCRAWRATRSRGLALPGRSLRLRSAVAPRAALLLDGLQQGPQHVQV